MNGHLNGHLSLCLYVSGPAKLFETGPATSAWLADGWSANRSANGSTAAAAHHEPNARSAATSTAAVSTAPDDDGESKVIRRVL